MFGNDLFLQTGGRRDLPEFCAQRRLSRGMFLQPAREFRVRFRQRERFGDLRVFRIRRAGPVKQELLFDFVAIHKLGGGFWPAARSRASRCCNWPRPRARRDLTVPSGTPRISAISL